MRWHAYHPCLFITFTALPLYHHLQFQEHDLTLFFCGYELYLYCVYSWSITPSWKKTIFFLWVFRNYRFRLRIFLANFNGKQTTYLWLFLQSEGIGCSCSSSIVFKVVVFYLDPHNVLEYNVVLEYGNNWKYLCTVYFCMCFQLSRFFCFSPKLKTECRLVLICSYIVFCCFYLCVSECVCVEWWCDVLRAWVFRWKWWPLESSTFAALFSEKRC